MYRQDERIRGSLRRPIAVALLVVAALVAPTWLWFVRGRQLPLRAVAQADRYMAAAGTTIALSARVTPSSEVDLQWTGPGLASHLPQTRWTLPATPGVHTATLTVRRSGSVARDAISILTTSDTPKSYPLHLPPARPDPAAILSREPCQGTSRLPRIMLEGRPCPGATLVARLQPSQSGDVWFWWQDDSKEARRGPLANLRVPRAPKAVGGNPSARRSDTAQSVLVATTVDGARDCRLIVRQAVTHEQCVAGPQLEAPFADFGWRLIGPATFRFAAKPPRVASSDPPSYRWRFGDGKGVETSKPTVVHRYGDKRRQHVVRLTLRLGTRQFRTLRAITDRTAAAR